MNRKASQPCLWRHGRAGTPTNSRRCSTRMRSSSMSPGFGGTIVKRSGKRMPMSSGCQPSGSRCGTRPQMCPFSYRQATRRHPASGGHATALVQAEEYGLLRAAPVDRDGTAAKNTHQFHWARCCRPALDFTGRCVALSLTARCGGSGIDCTCRIHGGQLVGT